MKDKILFLVRLAQLMHGATKMNELYFDKLDKDKNINIKK